MSLSVLYRFMKLFHYDDFPTFQKQKNNKYATVSTDKVKETVGQKQNRLWKNTILKTFFKIISQTRGWVPCHINWHLSFKTVRVRPTNNLFRNEF